ncbi:MAG: translesion error-prone DNA polymerase V autoproteolytic subunit [Cyanobacteria bacterium M_surface_10_m2_119]|nr:translesion error-prone DNA polymerase V autoproteolytic subunit [Cyanobacteria bacterium M_surface_10_m2_119]
MALRAAGQPEQLGQPEQPEAGTGAGGGRISGWPVPRAAVLAALAGAADAERPGGRRLLPLAGTAVAAGFPSPADDYIESRIDLNDVLIRHPSSTFFLRVSGDSMRDAGILDGDLLVVDRAIEPRAGRVVVAVLEGAFTLKYLNRHQGRWRLEAAHPDYPPLELAERDDARIWGVAIHAIHSL